jgi:folylpolyglutamate synthase/dihydropteroate synthase
MERSADPELLAETASDSTPRRVMHDPRAAVRALVDQSDSQDVIVVAGSLYLVGEVRPTLERIAAERTAIDKTGTVPLS